MADESRPKPAAQAGALLAPTFSPGEERSHESGPADDREPALLSAGRRLRGVLDELSARYPEREALLAQAALALVAREHLLVFGPPGTGKSEIVARLVRRFVDEHGAPSVFARQIVETTVQTDLVGPVDFKVLTETGRTVHRLEEGILAAEFAVLDEAFDGRDLLLRSILSVLNERELALGTQVVRARLASAFLTTNRYLTELLAARPETLLAFCDRIAFTAFVPKDFAQPASRAVLLGNVASRGTRAGETTMPLADLALLQAAACGVEVPQQTLEALASLVDEFERLRAEATADHKGYVPASYFSPRTLTKAVATLRAAVVRDRYLNQTERPLRADVDDLSSLALLFVPAGPEADDLGRLAGKSRDRRERFQLEALQAEGGAFRQALERVTQEMRRAVAQEAELVGLVRLRRVARDGSARAAMDLVLAVEGALDKSRSLEVRRELSELAAAAAMRFAQALEGGRIVDPPSADPLKRVQGYRALARALVELCHRPDVARRVAENGLSSARTALAAIVSTYTVEEFDDHKSASAADVSERVADVDVEIAGIVRAAEDLRDRAGAGADATDELSKLAAAARRAAAQTLRRRATRTAQRLLLLPEVDPWRALSEAAKALERVDDALARLHPEEATARTQALASTCAQIVAGEIESWPAVRIEELAALVGRSAERMERLGVDARAVFARQWPQVEDKLERWMHNRPLRATTDADGVSEEGYLRLLSRSRGAQDRRSLARLIAVLGQQTTLLRIDALLARADLAELGEQVAYLHRWFDQVVASVPAPSELASAEEAEAAWNAVNGSRFFAVGWRDNDLAALRDRLASYQAFPAIAAEAEKATRAVEGLAARATQFGQTLLERRAELAA